MRIILIFGLIMVIAMGVSEVCASSAMCQSCSDTHFSDDANLNHGIDISKHYHSEYFDIFMDYMSHLFSDISNMIHGLFH